MALPSDLLPQPLASPSTVMSSSSTVSPVPKSKSKLKWVWVALVLAAAIVAAVLIWYFTSNTTRPPSWTEEEKEKARERLEFELRQYCASAANESATCMVNVLCKHMSYKEFLENDALPSGIDELAACLKPCVRAFVTETNPRSSECADCIVHKIIELIKYLLNHPDGEDMDFEQELIKIKEACEHACGMKPAEAQKQLWHLRQ